VPRYFAKQLELHAYYPIIQGQKEKKRIKHDMGYLLLAHETHNLLAHHPACPNPTSTHGSMTRQPPPTSFLGVARSRSSRMEDHGSPPSHSSPVLHPASSLDAASAPLPHPADATSAPLPHPASLLDAASAPLLGVDCV
jgi:hypothetical protein